MTNQDFDYYRQEASQLGLSITIKGVHLKVTHNATEEVIAHVLPCNFDHFLYGYRVCKYRYEPIQ